jgi:predicted RNA-binding protein with PIN domain
MAIHIIIDGYNLIRRSPELSDLDRKDLQLGRDALLDLLIAYKKVKPHKITVVFDGPAVPCLYGFRDRAKGIAIHYSCGGETADDVIRKMVHREKSKAVVVSSDREVMSTAESAGATVMDSAAFEDKITMARYLAVKGGDADMEHTGWVPTTRKKGPSHRLPKRKRKRRARVEKL